MSASCCLVLLYDSYDVLRCQPLTNERDTGGCWRAGNRVGPRGCAFIAPRLPYMNMLEILNLSSNNLGVDGAKALAASLPSCRTLKELHLRGTWLLHGVMAQPLVLDLVPPLVVSSRALCPGNNLKAVGVSHVAMALPYCTTLECLDLRCE